MNKLNRHQKKSSTTQTCSNKKEVMSGCSVDMPITKSGLSRLRKDVHLMQAINAPTTTFIRRRISEEFYLLWDNGHLKMKPIYIYLWRYEQLCAKTSIILSIKSILCILVKLEKTLKTSWTYWEKRLSVDCESIFKTIIDLNIMQTQPKNLFRLV